MIAKFNPLNILASSVKMYENSLTLQLSTNYSRRDKLPTV